MSPKRNYCIEATSPEEKKKKENGRKKTKTKKPKTEHNTLLLMCLTD